MFTVHCPHHDATVLLGTTHIVAIDSSPTGPVVRWRCHCGTRGTLRTGRPPVRRPAGG